MYVDGGTANVYGTTFSSNTVSDSGPDIRNSGGTIAIYSSCSAGESSNWGGE